MKPGLTKLIEVTGRIRAILFGFVCLLVLFAGLLVPGGKAVLFVRDWGYWFVLVGFILLLYHLYRLWPGWSRLGTEIGLDRWTYAAVGLSGLVMTAHQRPSFKILMDEIMLLGTSMQMHLHRIAEVPLRANEVQGVFTLMEGMVDKRPLFFPVLVSTMHDFFGYRPENALYINLGLAFIFMFLLAVLAKRVAGRIGACSAVFLASGLPLLGDNATGGGFELLNLVMFLLVVLLALRFQREKSELTLGALGYAILLLVQTRYESVILAFPALVVVLWVFLREQKVVLGWSVMLIPILMLLPLLHLKIFDLQPDHWQLGGLPGYSKPFSISYIPDNLLHAARFFFAAPSDQPSSLLLSIAGLVAIPFCLLYIYNALVGRGRLQSFEIVFLLFTAGLLCHFVFMMCYFWGRFDDVLIRRLSLPSNLFFVFTVMMVFAHVLKGERLQRIVCCGFFAFALCVAVPAMVTQPYNQGYLIGKETVWRRQFMQFFPKKDYYVIDNDSLLWITHKVPAMPVEQAQARRAQLEFHLGNHSYSGIYVFQRFRVDPSNGNVRVREEDDLGPDFKLEKVWEDRFRMLTVSRISRLVAISTNGGETIRADAPAQEGRISPDAADLEAARIEYIRHYLKMLP